MTDMATSRERVVYIDDETGELSGSWRVVFDASGAPQLTERLSREPSIDELAQRAGSRAMTPEEFETHFGHLPRDSEG